MYHIALLLFITIFFTSCGSGGGSSSTSTSTTVQRQGFLVDSAVSGVEYTCNDIIGVTGENGEFTYTDSCQVVFKLGNILSFSIFKLIKPCLTISWIKLIG